MVPGAPRDARLVWNVPVERGLARPPIEAARAASESS